MNLQDAIQDYFDKKAAIDSAGIELQCITDHPLPMAFSKVRELESRKQEIVKQLKQTIDPQEVRQLRKELADAEEDLDAANQLLKNLESRVAFLKNYRKQGGDADFALEIARKAMWECKYKALLSSFDLLPEAWLVLEKLVAAQVEIGGPALFGRPLDEKFGRMDKERRDEVRDEMLTEMELLVR